jgi:5-methylcytosine-specific restriction endonuclease McrA
MSDERVPAWLKVQVAERASDCCEYCRSQARFAMQAFSAEHIEPRSQEGTNALDNLALACQGCNNHKYNKTQASDPTTGEQVPLFHPRRQRWQDHFAWSEDCTLIIGLTATGRATVAALQLNRSGLVNLRRILHAAGEHPPQTTAGQTSSSCS